MKTKLTFIVALALHLSVHAQLALQITSAPTNSVQMNWGSTSGSTYQLLGTSNADAFAYWRVLTNVVAGSTNSGVIIPRTNNINFYKLQQLGVTGAGNPAVRIVSHTNGDIVTGLTRVVVSAGDDSRLSFVSLYIDGQQYEGSIADGDLYWLVNTGTFSNGVHTVQALAVDNAGNPDLGGSGSSSVGGNETFSSAVTLTFTNVVRWLNPVTSFSDFVPVSVRSDVFPTNWTVYVRNESGTVVRNFGGYSSDGIIETNWNGRDNNGALVTSKRGYEVLFTLGNLPSASLEESQPNTNPPPSLNGAGFQSSQETFAWPVEPNQFGTWEYEIARPLPPLPAIYFDEEVAKKIAKGLHPPLPPVNPHFFSLDPANPGYRLTRGSILEAASANTIEAAAAGSGIVSPPFTNSIIVWFEDPWTSKQTLLARQKFYGGPTVQALNAAFGTDMASLHTMITDAQQSGDPDLAERGVLGGGASVVDVSGDFDALLNDLTRTDVTDFYYIGHANGNGIGYSEGSPTNGISTRKLSITAGNFSVRNSPKWGGRWLFRINKPYRFAFIDGCLSAKGPFHEAFGIIDGNYDQMGRHYRAYMGWNTKTKNSMLNTSQRLWSQKFWLAWLNPSGTTPYNRDLNLAIDVATSQQSIPEQPKVFGFNKLRWRD